MFSRLFQRKKKYVSGPIQGRLMMRMAVYWVMYHVILWHAILAFRYIEFRFRSTVTGEQIALHDFYSRFVQDFYPILVCAIVALPIVLVDLMHLTHRIAGPLVRFQNALRGLIAGEEIRKVGLRKGDLLIEFQDEFNRYLDFLAQQKAARIVESDGIDEHAEHVLIEVDQLRRSVQDAITAASHTGDSTFCTADTVISSSAPV